MARFSAVLDACVLVPVTQADSLLRLAAAGLYRPLWSARILDEMVDALERIHPDMMATGAARRRASVMNAAFVDACVEEGDGAMLTAFELPDADDAHVVEAAVWGRADVIVTNNLKDFPDSALSRLNLQAQHPDRFLLDQLDLDPDRVMGALSEQAAATRNPALNLGAVLERLERCGDVEFSTAARRQMWRAGRLAT